jgi:hypothetical protein
MTRTKQGLKKLFTAGFLFTALLFSACSNKQGKPDDFDYGKVEKDKYTNTYFQMEMDIPKGWTVQSKEQLEDISKKGIDLTAGDNKEMKAALKASEINSANLLAVFKHEVGSALEFNPNFMVVAENLKSAPSIKNGGDYLTQTRKLLEQSQMKYDSISETYEKTTIGGQEFYVMSAHISYMEMSISQVYYSTIRNGFCLSAIISYSGEEQKAELEQAVRSMKFK